MDYTLHLESALWFFGKLINFFLTKNSLLFSANYAWSNVQFFTPKFGNLTGFFFLSLVLLDVHQYIKKISQLLIILPHFSAYSVSRRLIFTKSSFCFSGEIAPCYADQVGLKLAVLLPALPKCWDDRHATVCPVSYFNLEVGVEIMNTSFL